VYKHRIPGYDRRVNGGRRWALLGVDVLICVVLVAFGVSADSSSGLANGTSVDTLLLPVVVLPILARRRCWRAPSSAGFPPSTSSGWRWWFRRGC
jgi:hypothetical protein